jgi:hypothetical protein
MKKRNCNVFFITSLCLVSLISGIHPDLKAREEKKSNEYYIPIIDYEPYKFIVSIQNAFIRLPDTDYLRIVKNGDSTKCFINQGCETFEITGLTPGEKEVNIALKWMHISGILDRIGQDSLFIVNLEPGTRYSRFYDVFPLFFFGAVTRDGIKYYKNEKGDRNEYSLSEIIEMKYGSVDEYKKKLLSRIALNIDQNIYNGLYEANKKSAIKFLQNDFVFYWESFPEDKKNIFQLFFKFLDDNITCSSEQKREIMDSVENAELSTRETNLFRYPKNENTIELLGKDITGIMKKVLSQREFEYIQTKNRINYHLRHAYLNGPLNDPDDTRYKKTDNTGKNSYIFVWDKIWLKNVLTLVKGEFIRLTREEEKQKLKKIVFEK